MAEAAERAGQDAKDIRDQAAMRPAKWACIESVSQSIYRVRYSTDWERPSALFAIRLGADRVRVWPALVGGGDPQKLRRQIIRCTVKTTPNGIELEALEEGFQ